MRTTSEQQANEMGARIVPSYWLHPDIRKQLQPDLQQRLKVSRGQSARTARLAR